MEIVSKKAFTLIELLVVITIIGILATWAVSVYTSQIQKWRDATRISSLEALRWSVEQYYQDASEYPPALSGSWTTTWVLMYMAALPRDPKSWQAASSFLDYSYFVWPDNNSLTGQEYEVSTWFEASWNVAGKAANAKDNWNNDKRLEVWIEVWTNSSWSWTTAVTTGAFTSCGTNCIIIK
jgi:prepilin-type N-terminal cleavage/methylation domain-containing protein